METFFSFLSTPVTTEGLTMAGLLGAVLVFGLILIALYVGASLIVNYIMAKNGTVLPDGFNEWKILAFALKAIIVMIALILLEAACVSINTTYTVKLLLDEQQLEQEFVQVKSDKVLNSGDTVVVSLSKIVGDVKTLYGDWRIADYLKNDTAQVSLGTKITISKKGIVQ